MIKFELNKECFKKLFAAFKNPTEVTSYSDLDHVILAGKKHIAGYSVNGEETILACGPGYGFYFGPTTEGDILITLLRDGELVQEVPASQLTENELSVIRGVFLSSGNFETTHPMLRDIPMPFSGSGLTEEQYQARKERLIAAGRKVRCSLDIAGYRAVLDRLQKQNGPVIEIPDWDGLDDVLCNYGAPEVALLKVANGESFAVVIPGPTGPTVVREVIGELYYDIRSPLLNKRLHTCGKSVESMSEYRRGDIEYAFGEILSN